MVILAASICTRGGKAVLSRQFREIARSRIEALLASFPKLADSGTQHTTVEQDNVRFLRISDQSFTKLKLDLKANPTHGAQYRTHPNVDKALFTNSKTIQLKDTSKRFPANNSIGVLRWRVASSDDADLLPITFTAWINKGSDSTTVTVEYELSGSESLKDVVVTIPFQTVEPSISSFDAVYEVTGDSIDWNIGNVDDSNNSGSFEFESNNPDGDENEFFPMTVRFNKPSPFVDVDVLGVSLVEMEGEGVNFSKDVKCIAEGYMIE
ncbi:coatomer subunit delta [Coccidioides immitis RMSCC 3703]|uniref:Coatomer subunit delta n=1 Tax=Coccidioides immitis RMSCC 3703 TaxID=454286 RepID=A0A0J8RAR2_COCIT|nr:coatomer subunit delta [Coccidioides immitis RMSCC 3703]